MNEPVKISLCMGSSCFARGNDRLLETLERAVGENGWEDKVFLAGARCDNRCGEGPNVFVDGEKIPDADAGVILDLIGDRLRESKREQIEQQQ